MKKFNEEKIIKVLSLVEQIRQHDGVGSTASEGVAA